MNFLLGTFKLNLENIAHYKEYFGRLFKGKNKYFLLMSGSHFVGSNVDVADIQTNAKTTSDVYHFVSLKDEQQRRSLQNLMVFQSEKYFTYFVKDRFFRHLSHVERLIKYCIKTGVAVERMEKMFECIAVITEDGAVEIKYADELYAFVNEVFNQAGIISYSFEIDPKTNKMKLCMKDKTGQTTFNVCDKLDDTKSMCFFRSYLHCREHVGTLSVGYSCGHDVLSSITMFYIDHMKAIRQAPERLQSLVIDPIKRTMMELSKLNYYGHVITKEVKTLFPEFELLSVKIPVLVGVNHPVPLDKSPFKLDIVVWREEGTLRHSYVFINDKYHVISFMPQTSFFMSTF